MKEKKKKILQ